MPKINTSLFANLLSIPFGENFSYRVVKILFEQTTSPLDLAQTVILVPNHRAALTLKSLFPAISPLNKQSLLLPKISSLSDISNNPLGLSEIDALPSSLSPWQRLGTLSKLVLKLPGYESTSQALKAAQALGTLLDEIQRLGIELKEIENLVAEDYAQHWQHNLQFLKIITHEWPNILKEWNLIDSQTRIRLALLALANHWKNHPPHHRIVIAGATGATPGITELMKTILGLPQGQVFLYGLDSETALEAFLPLTHPQYALQAPLRHCEERSDMAIQAVLIHGLPRLLPGLAMTGKEQKLEFLPLENKLSIARNQILQATMNNKELTLPEAFASQYWPEMVVCENLREEAKVIALMMRHAIDTTTGAIVLVTPNQKLGAWVEQELARWNLVANQSEGTSLADTPVARFLLSVATYLQHPTPNSFLSVLKHPFYEKTFNRQEHLERVRTLEIELFRQPNFDFANLRNGFTVKDSTLNEWLDYHLTNLSLPLKKTQEQPLRDLLDFHLSLCQKLVSSEAEDCPLWHQADGLAVKAFLENLKENSEHFPFLSWSQYSALLLTLLKQEEKLHKGEGIGSRLYILGTFESRLSNAEVMILGSLNEDSWPQPLQDNPWLSHSMRQKAGLPLSEWYIGLLAHDFCGCFYAPKLYLTRSQEENGTPTLPSRWWHRLEAAYDKNQLKLANINTLPWKAWAQALTQTKEQIKIGPPAPAPTLEARPKRLYVTDIERLMRDPYGAYVKHCLRLKPLPFFQELSSALKKGQMIHVLLDQYIKSIKNNSDITLKNFLSLAEPYFQKDPISQTFWWNPFQKLAAWIVEQLKNSSADQYLSEEKGGVTLEIDNQIIEIAAIADRIDIKHNQLTVIDYKTGTLPSLKEVEKGLYPQLSLEAWLAQQQGFKSIKGLAFSSIKAELWHLKGKEPAGKIVPINMDEEFLQNVGKSLYWLLKTFLRPETPYLACPIPEQTPFYNDYEHIERLKEWLVN
jgi:ATP-dependent helicase/nuclease subunit B